MRLEGHPAGCCVSVLKIDKALSMGRWHSLVAKGEQCTNHHKNFSQIQFIKGSLKGELLLASKNFEFI